MGTDSDLLTDNDLVDTDIFKDAVQSGKDMEACRGVCARLPHRNLWPLSSY